MASWSSNYNVVSISVFLVVVLVSALLPAATAAECKLEHDGTCHDKATALKLKVIAIFVILVASMIGVSLPIFSRSLPALRPDRDFFVLVKAFSSGVILATGYMHVLPDSFDQLQSECLPENPWHKFPFTAFIAMLAAIFTLMVDSFSIGFLKKRISNNIADESETGEIARRNQDKELVPPSFGHGHGGHGNVKDVDGEEQLLKYRVVAQVLELGIVVHSVVIGLSMGASENPCSIKPLIAALCFHQLFEGMGLGGCIMQAEYGYKMKGILVFFFSVTTPFGIALGIGLSNVYSDNSPTSLIVEGVLNAISAGLLNYMALVELLASDFMGPRLQGNLKLQIWSFVAVLLGVGGMSLMAKWA